MKLLKTKEIYLRGVIDIYEAKDSADIIWVIGEQIMSACCFYKPEKDLEKLLETYGPEFDNGLMIEAEVNTRDFYNRKVKLFNFHGAMKLCAAIRRFDAQEVIDALFDAVQHLDDNKSDMQPFKYENKQLRVVKDDERTLWFVAKDICDVLELSDVNKSVANLDDDEKLVRKIFVSGQKRDVITVSEAGLYSLVLRSNKPEARKFKRWVTHEVIPSIRKTGQYSLKSKGKKLPLPERIDLSPCYFYTMQEVANEADISYNQLEKLISMHKLEKYVVYKNGRRHLTPDGRYDILQLADDFNSLKALS